MKKKKIIVENFWDSDFGDKRAPELTEEQLGWNKAQRDDGHSDDTKDVFDYLIGCLNWDLSFYYSVKDKYYYIDMSHNVVIARDTDPDWDGKHIVYKSNPWGLEWYDRDRPDLILMHFKNVKEVWDNFKIDGKDMRFIIEHSVLWLSH